MDINTENYQLKWHSFGTYLHGCVAAALNGDQFADVALITLDGRQINAHRFILSACSQYLQQVLKLQTKTTLPQSNLSIIMPPEISHKTLKVLVQYMYSGETTVSQDILESVLRGGDLLKVKGLWRPKEDEPAEKVERSVNERVDRDRDRDKDRERADKKSYSKLNSRHARDSTHGYSHTHSNAHSNSSRSNASTPSHTYSQNSTCSTPVNNSVIKEPRSLYDRGGEKYDRYESLERLDLIDKPERSEKQNRAEKSEKHSKPDRADKNIPTKRSKNDESVIKTTLQTPPPLAPIQIRHKQDRIDRHERQERVEKSDKQEKLSKTNDTVNEKEISTAKDLMQILVIKEEPLEWSEVNQEEIELVEREEIFDSELLIKPEIQMDDGEENPESLYTPLTCELCAETFTLPADWVKHVQTHTDMMPAKRQKRGRPSNDEDNSNFPPLQCDMCQEYFPTPAKWVQHIQFAHTEQEMQHANKSTSRHSNTNSSSGNGSGNGGNGRQGRSSVGGQAKITSQHKVCAVCSKKFPSHASMIIHRRTHTGERPYMCDYCCKGFNVKSNLLRHLRTLHDKYVSPNDIESKEGDESDV